MNTLLIDAINWIDRQYAYHAPIDHIKAVVRDLFARKLSRIEVSILLSYVQYHN